MSNARAASGEERLWHRSLIQLTRGMFEAMLAAADSYTARYNELGWAGKVVVGELTPNERGHVPIVAVDRGISALGTLMHPVGRGSVATVLELYNDRVPGETYEDALVGPFDTQMAFLEEFFVTQDSSGAARE